MKPINKASNRGLARAKVENIRGPFCAPISSELAGLLWWDNRPQVNLFQCFPQPGIHTVLGGSARGPLNEHMHKSSHSLDLVTAFFEQGNLVGYARVPELGYAHANLGYGWVGNGCQEVRVGVHCQAILR